MPEGHKTHFIAREQTSLLAGQPLKVTSPQGRFRGDARRVSGRILDEVTAIGKHLFYHFDGAQMIHIHLGRYGKFRQHESPPPPPVGQVRVRMVGVRAAIDLNGPTTCRVIDSQLQQQVLAKLGPDPLSGGRKVDVWKVVKQSKKPIGALLLDQSVIAGVGNIFRAEMLFDVEMDPATRGCDLSAESFSRLWKSITKMMKTGLKYGRIITVTAKEAGRPLAKVDGGDRFRVYSKQQCPRCDSPIQVSEMAGRKLYFCSQCQR